MKPTLLFAFLLSLIAGCTDAQHQPTDSESLRIIPAAERTDLYLPLLEGKTVGIFANHTSVARDKHLVDLLKEKGVEIKAIFAPEHGFRGTADAGEKFDNSVDPETGISIISLYGPKRKPTAEDLKDIDILIFDIQDVGTRFYTYISSLEDFMEAAIEHDKPLIVLDRPNPNGFYIDGPVLDRKFTSFVGMQPIPVVYGMTIGEYAKMLVGEKWLDSTLHGKLKASAEESGITVIPCENYSHSSKYVLPVKPSPNLPDIKSIYLYPSTCFFEGTTISEGRGTEGPFKIFGHPSYPDTLFAFTPVSMDGAKNPKLKDQQCYGWNLDGTVEEVLQRVDNKVQIKWLMEAYRLFPEKEKFFNGFFDKLAGSDVLKKQIIEGLSEEEIRKSWEPGIAEFKKIRKKYLMYEDFE